MQGPLALARRRPLNLFKTQFTATIFLHPRPVRTVQPQAGAAPGFRKTAQPARRSSGARPIAGRSASARVAALSSRRWQPIPQTFPNTWRRGWASAIGRLLRSRQSARRSTRAVGVTCASSKCPHWLPLAKRPNSPYWSRASASLTAGASRATCQTSACRPARRHCAPRCGSAGELQSAWGNDNVSTERSP